MAVTFKNNEETGYKNIHCRTRWSITSEKEEMLKRQTRQTMTDASRKKAARQHLISHRKRSLRFSFVCSRKRLCICYYAKRKHLWAMYGGFGGRSRLRLQGDWFSLVRERGEKKKIRRTSEKFSFLSSLHSFPFISFCF